MCELVSRQRQRTFYRRVMKRVLDLFLATSAAVILSPLMLVVALFVRCRMGSPVLFRQPRAGKHGRIFTLFKFRTMRDALDAQGRQLPDDARITPLGRRLRSLSLDELPQLWNIIRGDMSVVGPRPLLVHYLPRYSPEQARRHDVRPGVTGWAQVNGRNAIGWPDKFRLDVWYVDHCSFLLDLKILARTLACVLRREGISAADHATMAEFMGEASQPATQQPLKAQNHG
jgi:lipopolysaccharide/colanic/teichoic acid biosynthesis glycosyltransferase